MIYGQIRLRLWQLVPGVAIELVDGWLQDRYTQMLDALPWKRLEGEVVLQSPPSYQVGTVSVTQGSNAITGVGTDWTPFMTGLMIRIASNPEFYTYPDRGVPVRWTGRTKEAPRLLRAARSARRARATKRATRSG